MIQSVVNSDSIQVLESVMQFTGARHRLITNNIANLSTPGFQPQDLSVTDFQKQLRAAIDARRASGQQHELNIQPQAMKPNPVHDANVERTMQSLVENFMTYRTAGELLGSRFDVLNSAIRERI